MKIMKKLSILLILSITIIACSENSDDNGSDQGGEHSYDITFAGGTMSGRNITGSVPPNDGGANYGLFEGLQGIVANINDEEQDRNFTVVINRIPGDTNLELIEGEDGEPGALIGLFFDNQTQHYQSQNGTINISNFTTYNGNDTYGQATFKMNFEGEFVESPSEETVYISGSMTFIRK